MDLSAFKLDPIKTLLQDEAITDIMVNDYKNIFFERNGQMQKASLSFSTEQNLLEAILAIARFCGKDVNDARPFLDGQLPDGSRINAVLYPMAPGGANLTIRKFRHLPFNLEELIKMGHLSHKAAYLLHACVRARLNIVVSGGTGSGKTTFLNVLSGLIPEDERIVTIEDVAELHLQHPNWVRLESVQGFSGNKGITTKDCLVNSLRMRPDRIIVGECRREETFEMLQAMNTGHDGSMTTVHANTPRDCLARIESLIASSNLDYPLAALRKQMSSAIDLIVQLKRNKNGQRVVQEITEVTGIEQGVITTLQLFSRERTGSLIQQGDNQLASTGLVPTFMQKFAENGIQFPPAFFDENTKIIYRPE